MADELNGRLELKSYKSAYLYYHMEDYLAVHYALKNVLKENADNRYREEILYYTAMSAYKYASMSVPEKQRERYLTFVDEYFNIVSEYPESQYRKELDGLYSKVQKILKKDSPEENN
jgi:outer membrane protein assembly factor BamD